MSFNTDRQRFLDVRADKTVEDLKLCFAASLTNEISAFNLARVLLKYILVANVTATSLIILHFNVLVSKS